MTTISVSEPSAEGPVGSVAVKVAGEVDLAESATLLDQLTASATGSTAEVVVDLSATTFFCSSALGALIEARRALSERGVVLRVGPRSAVVERVFELTGMQQQFPT